MERYNSKTNEAERIQGMKKCILYVLLINEKFYCNTNIQIAEKYISKNEFSLHETLREIGKSY